MVGEGGYDGDHQSQLECGLSDQKEIVKSWYDGFTFGHHGDIYNPWSVLNFLDKRNVGTYWANTSSNSLVGKLIREGNPGIKQVLERLLNGESIHAPIDEQIVYNQLDDNAKGIAKERIRKYGFAFAGKEVLIG